MSSPRAQWLVVALAALVPLLFAAFTAHAWEDYFITLRASRNLVDGHGLVFTPGERVHSFTSPLGTLLPAVCLALTGTEHEIGALWLFRLINAAALAGGAWLLWRHSAALKMSVTGRVALFGLLLFDAKLTDFSINGMETALLVFFALVLWCEFERATGPRAGRLAFAYAGLMWTRPDAFVLAGVITVAAWVFPQRGAAAERAPRPWSPLWRGVLLGAACYAPWFAWAWWYYGSPVPHTVVAKAAVSPPPEFVRMLTVPWRVLLGRESGGDLFMPAYAAFGGWPKPLAHLAHVLTVVAMFAWPFRFVPAPGRRASLALFLGAFYFQSIVLFPWYVPPWTVLAILALAWVIDAGARAAQPAVASAARIAALATVATQVLVCAAVAWQLHVHQRLVENAIRRPIGEWLRAHAAPHDTVMLEPLGYIGYYSRLKIFDYPGLGSPEVVRVIREGAIDFASVIARLRPEWVVLRPFEIRQIEGARVPALENYEWVRTWSARPQLDAVRFLPGRRWCEWEAEYAVFRRKADASGLSKTPAP